jgi:membrane-associated protein
MIAQFLDLLLHIDKYLGAVIQNYGPETYVLLFLIIFLETGLVIMPFLPGDSLLFAAGTFAAQGFLSPGWLFLLLALAAIAGDAVNYWIGYRVGEKIFEKDRPFLNEEYLKRTQRFYEKDGKRTIISARFVPIIRTFAPFIAGVSKMRYPEFAFYNIVGGAAWVALFVFGGYFFGNAPLVRENLTLVILAVIAISFIPPIIAYRKHKNSY